MATRTWTGLAGDGNWNTAGNWSGGAVPVAGDDVIVGGSSTIDQGAFVVPTGGSLNSADFSGFTGSLISSIAGNHLFNMALAGDLTLSATMDASLLDIGFTGSGSFTFTTGGRTITALFNGGSATITLVGALQTTSTFLSTIDVASGTLIFGGDIICESFETDGGNIVQGGHKLHVNTTVTNDGFFIEGACTWTWSGGAQIILAPAPATELDVYVDAVVTPSLPPVFVNGAGTAKLFDGNLTCQTFFVVAGVWDANGNAVIQTATMFTGAVNSEWYNGGNWSAGGVPDGSVLILFDSLSPDCHLDFGIGGAADAEAGIDFTGYTGALSHAGAGFRLILGTGPVTLSAAMTGSKLQLTGGGGTITSNGIQIDFLSARGGTTTLGDAMDAASFVNTNGFGGTLDFNGNTLTTPDFSTQVGDSLAGLGGATLDCSTFDSKSDMVGASVFTLHATTSAAAHNATITNCHSTATTLNATDGCTNGGGNANVNFGASIPTTTAGFWMM